MDRGRAMPEEQDDLSREPPLAQTTDQQRGDGMRQPGSMAFPSRGDRVLFPLPHVACPPRKIGASRRVQQRRDRIRKAAENINEAIDSVNWLAGVSTADVSLSSASPMQRQSVLRVEGLISSQKPSGSIETCEAALSELLKGGSPYDLGVAHETLASYRSELVSIPSDISGCPRLNDVLPPDDRQYMEENSELMLKPGTEEMTDSLVPYWDPKIKFNQKAYHELVKRLHNIGYFNYTLHPACHVGVFFVWKSSKTKLRMITDARLSNSLFKEPPGVCLMTGEGLGRIEVTLDDLTWPSPEAVEAISIHVGLSDVKDCFHRMRVPTWLSRYFAWRAVPAKVVGLEGSVVDGVKLSALDAVFPCAGSLCQGFSWSLYFAQRANEYIAGRVDPLADSRLANDRSGPMTLVIGQDIAVNSHFYVYVDNLGVVGTDEGQVHEAMSALQKSFNGLGLQLHASEVSDGYVEALGCVLEGGQMRSRPNPKRMWRIHHGIKAMLGRGRCTGKALEILVGHCTFLGLINRASLSIFHNVYSFIRKHYWEVAVLWESVRGELRAFMGVCFLLCQDWWRPWNQLVTSSDASLGGYGGCKSWWPREVVSRVGRNIERSRFKRLGSHSASAGFQHDGQNWGPLTETSAKRLNEAGWGVDPGFEEVPSGALKRNLWSPVFWGAWKYKENIGVLEARTVLKSLKRICLTRYGHDIRHLHICDNLGVVLSIERFRSKNYKLLKIIRCIAAYCFCRNISFSIRWVPSELNIADEPSRIHDPSDSKLLVDLIESPDFVSFSPQDAPTSKQQQNTAVAAAGQCGEGHQNGQGSSSDKAAESESRSSGRCEESTCEDKRVGHKWLHEEKAGREKGESRDASHERRQSGFDSREQEGECERRRLREQQHLIRVAGREARRQKAHLAKQSKKAASTNGGWWHDGQAGAVTAGVSISGASGSRKLPEALDGAETACHSDWGGSQFRHTGRQDDCGVFQSKVPGRRREPLWRLHSGGFDGSTSGLRKVREQEDSEELAVFARLAQVVPVSLEACIPPPGLGSYKLADGCDGPCSEGCFQPASSVNLSQTRCFAGSEKVGACAAYFGSDRDMEHGDFADGDNRCFQSGHKGRLDHAGLGVVAIPESNSRRAGSWGSNGQGMDLQLCRVPDSVQKVRGGAQRASGSIPGQTLRAKYRSSKQKSRPGRSEKERGLDDSAERESLREGWKIGCNVAEVGSCNSSNVQVSRTASGKHHARPSISSYPTSGMKKADGYFADFFSGAGGVARAIRSLGFKTREWELSKGVHCDLTDSKVLMKIREDIAALLILGAMLAPPCSSFSPARDRTMVVRTRDYPWGLPNLPDHELQKVIVGNKCIKCALLIIKWLDSKKLPWVIENPHSSKIWFLPPLQRLQKARHTEVVVTDFCCYGTRWRKRTRLLCGNIDEADLMRLRRMCRGPPGICERTGLPHFHLTGSNRHGVPWTTVAQPYPVKLCHQLAFSLTAHLQVVEHKH